MPRILAIHDRIDQEGLVLVRGQLHAGHVRQELLLGQLALLRQVLQQHDALLVARAEEHGLQQPEQGEGGAEERALALRQDHVPDARARRERQRLRRMRARSAGAYY